MSEAKIRRHGSQYIIECPYCAAEFRVPSTISYATCPYCGTTIKIAAKSVEREHFIFRLNISRNKAYELTKQFASQQFGAPRDIAERAGYGSVKLHFIPLYIYYIDIRAYCGDKEAGQETGYSAALALENPPIPIPRNYNFPIRGREYFKPAKIKQGS